MHFAELGIELLRAGRTAQQVAGETETEHRTEEKTAGEQVAGAHQQLLEGGAVPPGLQRRIHLRHVDHLVVVEQLAYERRLVRIEISTIAPMIVGNHGLFHGNAQAADFQQREPAGEQHARETDDRNEIRPPPPDEILEAIATGKDSATNRPGTRPQPALAAEFHEHHGRHHNVADEIEQEVLAPGGRGGGGTGGVDISILPATVTEPLLTSNLCP